MQNAVDLGHVPTITIHVASEKCSTGDTPPQKTPDREPGSKKQEGCVITPGGPRPADQVHTVRPGQAVRRKADGTFSIVPDIKQQ